MILVKVFKAIGLKKLGLKLGFKVYVSKLLESNNQNHDYY